MTCQRVQIAFVQLATQTCITSEASKIGVNRVFVPMNMLFHIGIDRNTSEISICLEGNISLWDYDPSWELRPLEPGRAGAQDKFVF